MRDFWDIRFRRAGRSDDIDPAAYSRDGYLIHQGRLSGISYGCKTSRETGCGWIACFNFLRFMNRPEPPQEVARRMERMLLWGGRIGSHPLAVWWYLHQKGFRFRTAFTCWGAGRVLERTAEIMEEEGIRDLSRVGFYGLTYKEDVDDTRESPGLQLLSVMKKHLAPVAKVYYPYVRQRIAENQYFDLEEFLEGVDLVVILAGHREIRENRKKLAGKAVLDTRNLAEYEGAYHLLEGSGS